MWSRFHFLGSKKISSTVSSLDDPYLIAGFIGFRLERQSQTSGAEFHSGEFQMPTWNEHIEFRAVTLPETNILVAPENKPSQKGISSSNHPFSGAMLVSGRVHPGKWRFWTQSYGGGWFKWLNPFQWRVIFRGTKGYFSGEFTHGFENGIPKTGIHGFHVALCWYNSIYFSHIQFFHDQGTWRSNQAYDMFKIKNKR